MKRMIFAAVTAVLLGFGATTMASAATGTNDGPWAHYVNQDNGQG